MGEMKLSMLNKYYKIIIILLKVKINILLKQRNQAKRQNKKLRKKLNSIRIHNILLQDNLRLAKRSL